MSRSSDSDRYSREFIEYILKDKLLKNAKTKNGIWIDSCSDEQVVSSLRNIMHVELIAAIVDYKDRALLEKLSTEAHKDFNTIVLEYIKKKGPTDWNYEEDEYDDIASANAYSDLALAFLDPEYEKLTAKVMYQHYAELFPKHYAQVQKYKQLLQEGGSADNALECLTILFGKETDSYKLIASLLFMGYEALAYKVPLPCFTIYHGIKLITTDHKEEKKGNPVEKLFNSFDPLSKENKLPEDPQNFDLDYHSSSIVSELRGQYTEGSILMKSKYFQKYLRKRREKMCEILGCADNELARTLYLKDSGNNIVTCQHTSLMSLCNEYSITPFRYVSTFFDVDSEEETNIEKLDNNVIPAFYYDKLRFYLANLEEIEEFTKRELYVEFGMNEIESDIAFFSQYKYFRTFAQMMNYDKQTLYRFFDFGQKKKGINVGTMSLRRDLEKCKDEIKEKDEQIAQLKKKSKAPLPKAKNNNEKYLRSELAKAEKENDNLIDENLTLKNKIRQMEEYIAAVENPTEEKEEHSSETAIDEALIRSKRIVFVCGSQNVTALIKREFPGSTILENETQTASRKDATDLVVFFTQHIAHKMFYRFKSDYKGVPDLYYSGSNFDTLKRKICEVLKEGEVHD